MVTVTRHLQNSTTAAYRYTETLATSWHFSLFGIDLVGNCRPFSLVDRDHRDLAAGTQTLPSSSSRIPPSPL
jgi:hypothetical protein